MAAGRGGGGREMTDKRERRERDKMEKGRMNGTKDDQRKKKVKRGKR